MSAAPANETSSNNKLVKVFVAGCLWYCWRRMKRGTNGQLNAAHLSDLSQPNERKLNSNEASRLVTTTTQTGRNPVQELRAREESIIASTAKISFAFLSLILFIFYLFLFPIALLPLIQPAPPASRHLRFALAKFFPA